MADDTTTLAKVIYVLLLAGLISGVTAVIGVVMAYVYMGDADVRLASHYRWQIRTFWIGVLYSAVAGLLTGVIIGYALLAAVAIWLIVRCAVGFRALERDQSVPDVETWLW